MIIKMVLEPKQKNFKGPIKNVEAVKKEYIRRHVSIPRAFG
jgi:hypothetical protein